MPNECEPFEVADALWLASRPGFGPRSTVDQLADGATGVAPGTLDGPAGPPASGSPPDLSAAHPPTGDEAYYLPLSSGSDSAGAPAAVWETGRVARSAADAHGVPARAETLRPLRLTVESTVDRELDEEVTAELGVINRRWPPVLRATGERRWDVVVVVDRGPMIEAWQTAINDFVAGLRRQAAFRDIQLRWLVEDADGEAALRSGPGGVTQTPTSLIDPTGRRMIFLLTHGGTTTWRSGAAHRLLATWAASMIVAAVHLLPQEAWRQSVDTVEVTWQPDGPARTTADLAWAENGLGRRTSATAGGAVAVPLMELDEQWLRRWARLMAGAVAGPVTMPAMITSADHGSSVARSGPGSPADLVAEFRASRSRLAYTLAIRLAAAPLTDETIWAIQRSMPRVAPAHVVEVLSSDLVRRVDGPDTGAGAIRFEFADGVRERLLSFGHRDRTIAVQHLVEDMLAASIPAVRGLTWRVRDPHRVEPSPVEPADAPYRRVELAVYQALSGPYLVAARQLRSALGSPPARPAGAHGRTVEHSHGGPPVDNIESLHGRANAIVNMLPPRNPNFTGRIDLLDALHQRLRTGTTAVLPEAVHGSGGVGKSQLVVEYVYRHVHDYDLIWWIPAERPAQIQSALVELAQRLDVTTTATANTAVPLVLNALRDGRPYSNWLLIFDNAESPDEVRRFFPEQGPGSIVVTSRNPQWTEVANSLQVDVFERGESIELLRKRSPALRADDADRMADALRDLPLAIELAAAYRAATDMPVGEYLSKLARGLPDLQDDEEEPDFPTFVAAAWNIALDALEQRDPVALRLLQVVAFMAPEPISKSLLQRAGRATVHPDLDPALRSDHRLTQAIRSISRFSLVRIDHRSGSFQMHRLAQRVLIAQMDAETQIAMRQAAHRLLAGADPGFPHDTQQWPLFGELYPHIVASAAERSGDERVHSLILNEAKYLWRWGDHTGARDLTLRAHEAWSAGIGEDHPDTLEAALWLGWMYFVVADYPAAARINTRTLELYRRTVGENSTETLDAMGGVAADLRITGDFEGALELSRSVHDRSQRTFGDEDPFTLRAAHNLAVSLRLSGLFGPALRQDEQTHQRMSWVYGTDHLITLDTHGGVNLDRRELGDYVTARNQQENVVSTVRRLVGSEDHPDLLRQSHSLAIFRRKAGDHDGALNSSLEVLRRYTYRYGGSHPATLLATLTSSIDLRVTGDLDEALRSGEAAVLGLRQLYGPTHPHTAGAEVDLAVTLRLLGRAEDARAIDERAHRVLTDRLGGSHALVLASGINLASDHFALGDHPIALDLDTRMLRQCRDLLRGSHPTTLACAHNLGLDLVEVGRVEESSVLRDDTLERFRTVLGHDHPATVAAVNGIRANCDIDPLPL